jgi:signal recognition particle GTPase
MEKQEGVEQKGIMLPTQVQKAKAKNLRTLLIYGLAKSGKTTAVSKLPNCLN